MQCKCGSTRIASVTGKTSDLCCYHVDHGDEHIDHDGYVPSNVGLGNDEDYIEFDYCLDCGSMQGKFPITKSAVKRIPSNAIYRRV